MNEKHLQIGDEIGFVKLANGIDENDTVIYLPVVEIGKTERNEIGYRVEYPDGEVTRRMIPHSALGSHMYQVRRKMFAPAPASVPTEKMISLNDRKQEFIEALERARESNLEVFPDWEEDEFVVKNHTTGKEYKVRISSPAGGAKVECECKDFEYRKRICKHISTVLIEAFFGEAIVR